MISRTLPPLVLALACICPATAAPPPGKGIPVKADTVRTGSIEQAISAVGTLRANESVIVRPEIAGRITAIHFGEGQAVKKGALLFSLDASEYEAQLGVSQADVKFNQQRLQRYHNLKKDNFISQDALDAQQGSDEQAKAKAQLDRTRLAKTRISAPFSGTLGLRGVSPGAYVQPGQELVRLEDDSVLKVDFRVPEVYVGQIKPGQTLDVTMDADANSRFKGQVQAFDTALDEKTRTLLVRAVIPNGDHKLRPGMFARINVPMQHGRQALLLPEQAVVPKGGNTFVYKIVDGKASLTRVQLGNRRPGEVEVLDGLAKGDQVVVEGQIKLQPGAPVMVLGPTAPAGKS